jgi:hypothetical protein
MARIPVAPDCQICKVADSSGRETSKRGRLKSMSMGTRGERAASDLGELRNLEPRSVWADEARDFTPWLLANEKELGRAIGIELELQEAEYPVGGFSLDLLGRDLTNGVKAIVENQIERSDHGHLGQLLTYAAGTDASTVVWIARSIREEHRQALNWLNEHTDEDTNFFGVEIQLIQIDNSRPAVTFVLAAQPNGWQKAVRASTSGQLAGRALAYQDFWTKFSDRLHAEYPEWSRAAPPSGNEFWMSASIRGAGFKCAFNGSGQLRHELYIDLPTAEESRALFDQLYSTREAVESAYGRKLDWDAAPTRKACRIIDSTEGDVMDISSHSQYIEFLLDAGLRFRRALSEVPGIGLS